MPLESKPESDTPVLSAKERRRVRTANRSVERPAEKSAPATDFVDASDSTPSSAVAPNPAPDMPPESTSNARPNHAAPDADRTPQVGPDGKPIEGQSPSEAPKPMTPLQEASMKLEIIKENKDAFEWILKQHSELRVEFISFLRKDMKEIQQVMAEVKSNGMGDEMGQGALDMVKNTYIEHWRKSFDPVPPDNVLKPSQPLGAPEDVAKGWFKQ